MPESLGGEAPEKYIRTLEGDINVFQRGGTPGLAPLKNAQVPAERLVAASPITATPASVPVQPPESEPVPSAPEAPPKPVPIQTYSDDFRQRMKETNASTATVLAAEQDAGPHAAPEEPAPRTDPRGPWYIAAGALLLIAGAAGSYFAYTRYLSSTTPITIGPTTPAPIFVDSTATVAGTGKALMQAVVQAVADPLPANAVRQLVPAAATSTDAVFLSLGVPVPSILVRNIHENGNLAGVVRTTNGQSAFFILTVDFYSATFSGLLLWETSMQRDLQALYPLYAAPAAPVASSTASTTPVAPRMKEGFRDELVSNHDVRIYRDSMGRSILLYGYWNPTTLIIARDPLAFAEILDRLATSRAQ